MKEYYIHTRIHIHAHTDTLTYIHIHTNTFIHIHPYTYIHAHKHIHKYIHTRSHTFTYRRIHAHTYTYMLKYIHIQTHTYIHIHTHIHTYYGGTLQYLYLLTTSFHPSSLLWPLLGLAEEKVPICEVSPGDTGGFLLPSIGVRLLYSSRLEGGGGENRERKKKLEAI